MKSLFGIAFRPKKAKRIKTEYHATEFARNLSAVAFKKADFKVRKIRRKVI